MKTLPLIISFGSYGRSRRFSLDFDKRLLYNGLVDVMGILFVLQGGIFSRFFDAHLNGDKVFVQTY